MYLVSGSRDEAEDLAQDAFVKVLERWDRVREMSNPAGYLYRAARDLLTAAAKARTVRDDVPADELAGYCISALSGAGSPRSKPVVRRLVSVVLDGLRPPR